MKSVVLGFGRFQPVHIGHEIMIKRMIQEAKDRSCEAVLFPTRTVDKKKNQMPFGRKVQILRSIFPDIRIHQDPFITSIFVFVHEFTIKGYNDIVIVAGSDRYEEYYEMFSKYLNHDDPKLSIDVKRFTVINTGERKENGNKYQLCSSTKLRQMAKENEFFSFWNCLPSKLGTATVKELFNYYR